MKKLLSLVFCGLLLFGCSDKYDDSALRNDLNDLENRVAKLEELCKQMNTNISSLQKIVVALQDNLSISKVEQISDGYIIHFSDGSTATIKNGKNSEDAPIIGVKKDTDGIYYWTLDGEWLTDEKGNKVKAQGTDGKDGVDGEDGTNGKDGITPQLKIENGRWMLSMDNGKTWTDIGQATGADGTDGEDGIDGKDGTNGIFKSVTEDNDNVYFTLEDDSVITIPKSDNSKFAIAFDTTDIAILNGGESKTISYTITDATKNTVVKAIAQDGWKVKVDATSTDKGTITITAPNPIVESEILVFANDGSYRTVMVSLNCMQGQINIADNSINATSAGGTQEIKLTTNLDYTIEIPEDAQSWLSLAPETRALREDTIVFEVTANEGMQRYTTVALKDEQGKILQTIIFRQLGTCTEVHVETKGELENELAGYDYANIESLKITGVLNDVDFLFIYHMMPKLRDLDISDVNITTLPTRVFYNSKNIENLILSKTLSTIDTEAFYNSALKSVIVPNGVTTIEKCAFQNCSELKDVTFQEDSQLRTIEGGYSYGAFYGCTSLTSIEIPASVQTIGEAAFEACVKLATVKFDKESRLETIDSRSFYSCPITTIDIPASVEIIGAAAFSGCTRLASVKFESNSQLKAIAGGYNPSDGAFYGCTSLTSIEIPASVQTIGKAAFQECTKLATVKFDKESRLKTIAPGSFYRCPITTIDIPASVQTIGEAAFQECTKLATVKFEAGSLLETLEGYSGSLYYGAFYGCTSLTSIEIPASVQTIGAATFQGCSRLADVKFEEGSKLSAIEGYCCGYGCYGAFLGCPLITIDIPASVQTIGEAAFQECTKLATVRFEHNSQLKSIEGGYYRSSSGSDYFSGPIGAFYRLPNLRTVDMSNCTQVESIGGYAFYGNSELRLVKIGTPTPPTCDQAAFGVNPQSVLKVPTGCADAYKAAIGWRGFTSITGLDE
ncbi:leucine-rich repeat protein [Alistipes putredinis]|uniref:leucine-rich repeat protein n=5 Tax=Alistipes putredinis TaxID=28117 RepID=UPI0024314858|nr:leucine-rich repeat protein [Alistipes putredinis]